VPNGAPAATADRQIDWAKRPRLYINAARMATGDVIDLSTASAHYVATVLRLGERDTLRVFNGVDGEFGASPLVRSDPIAAKSCARKMRRTSPEGLQLHVGEQLRPQPDDGAAAGGAAWLFFAPIRRHRMRSLVEKATELGVARLVPIRTARTERASELSLASMQSAVVEASEQSERLTLPLLCTSPRSLAEVAELVRDSETQLLVCAERSRTAVPLISALSDSKRRSVAFVVGPEGGFSGDELSALAAIDGASLVSLGPNILRAETATSLCLGAALLVTSARSENAHPT